MPNNNRIKFLNKIFKILRPIFLLTNRKIQVLKINLRINKPSNKLQQILNKVSQPHKISNQIF